MERGALIAVNTRFNLKEKKRMFRQSKWNFVAMKLVLKDGLIKRVIIDPNEISAGV